MTTRLKEKFDVLAGTPSDINEHFETLRRYASECAHVTEMGVRYVVSTFALMMGLPRRLVSIDIVHPDDKFGGENDVIKGKEELETARQCALENGVDFEFVLGNTLEIDIEPTDLLFIDTRHTYAQLKEELTRHHSNVSTYILMHDTMSFGNRDEILPEKEFLLSSPQGLRPAIQEFLATYPEWSILEEFHHNNGMIVLKKTPPSPIDQVIDQVVVETVEETTTTNVEEKNES